MLKYIISTKSWFDRFNGVWYYSGRIISARNKKVLFTLQFMTGDHTNLYHNARSLMGLSHDELIAFNETQTKKQCEEYGKDGHYKFSPELLGSED